MSSALPNNWKRPWTDDNERSAITLPEPTRSIYARDRQVSEPSTLDVDRERRDSIPSLRRTSPGLQNVDPEDRQIRAMPNSSHSDTYAQYLLSQDSPENSAKRMRMTANPWLDLKGNNHKLERQNVGSISSRHNIDQHTMTASIPTWTPMPVEATRPRDMSNLLHNKSPQSAKGCGNCDEANDIAPNLARGLQRLHEQLRHVAAKNSRTVERSSDLKSPEDYVPRNLLGSLDFSMNQLDASMKLAKELLLSVNTEIDDKTMRAGAFSRSSSISQLTSPGPSWPVTSSSATSPKPSDPSPTTTHLHDLQHQLSTKTLAHQVLQSEHEKLLTTYSRLQTKYSSLEKKQSAIDVEFGNAIEDRVDLQVQLESLQQQIIDVQASRDEAQKQSAANGSQYMQIMAMSSKLQAQGAADLRKYKLDRETWTSEKEALEAKVKLLEKAQGTASILAVSLAISGENIEEQNLADEAELATMSFDKLKEEITTLRRNVREASQMIHIMRNEGTTITKLSTELGAASERLIKLGVIPKVSDPKSEP